jgi:hypothetical protein
MPFNGTGTFTRVYNWVTDKVNGVNITASRVDTEDDGFATGLTNCVTRDGQGKMGADFLPGVTATYALGSASFTWTAINGVTFANFTRNDQENTISSSGAAFRTILRNTLGTGYTSLRLYNDVGTAVRSLEIDYAGSSYASSLVTGGPTGESAAIGTTGAIPMSLATNSTERIRIDGAGASINMLATSVQQNGMAIVPLTTFKTSATSRNTTTTFASDPDLAFSNVPIGTYEIEGVLFFDCSTAPGSNGGLKSQLSFSGTVANGIVAQIGSTGTNTVIANAYASFSGSTIAINNMSSASATATGNWIQFRGTVTLNTIQNVALQWAQSSSDSDPTILQIMSRLSLRRIA